MQIKIKKDVSDAFDQNVSSFAKRARPWRLQSSLSDHQNHNNQPTDTPIETPTVKPIEEPTDTPTDTPTVKPTEAVKPTVKPTVMTTDTPTPTVGQKVLYTSDISIKQRSLLLYLSTIRDYELPDCTRPVGYNRIATVIGTERIFVKRSIERLIQLGFLERKQSLNGKMKGTIYLLKTFENDISNTPTATVSPTVSPTRSSSRFLNSTTTFEDAPTVLDDHFLDDYSELSKIGFTKNHCIQILKTGNVAQEEMVRSLEYIHWSLENKTLKAEKPLAYIMSALRKGPFNRPDGFKSKREAWLEREANLLKEESARIKRLEKEVFQSHFTIWQSKLKPEELSEISPMFKSGEALEAVLVNYFRENIFQGGSNSVSAG